MVKIRNDSELKIWSLAEINNPAVRDPKYEKAEIIQIEPGCYEYEYIVEVLVKTDGIAYWEDIIVEKTDMEDFNPDPYGPPKKYATKYIVCPQCKNKIVLNAVR